MKRVLILAVLFAVLASGCTPTAVRRTETTPSTPDHVGKNPLYAQLDKVDGKYVITKINNTDKLTFVCNDLTPLFDIEKYECVFEGIGMKLVRGVSQKCRNDENTFRKLKQGFWGPQSAFSYNLYYSIFDSDTYYKAVEEGLSRSNINRQQLLAEYDNFMNSANELRNQYSNEYENYLKNNIKIVHQIEDKSGFYKNDIGLLPLYSINKNHIPQVIVTFNPPIESYKTFFDDLLKAYNDSLKSATSNYYLRYRDTQKVKDYMIEMTTPSTISYKKGETQNISVIFTIRSKDFKGIYPKYMNEDNALRVEFDGKGIRFINKTNNFLQIKTISIYYNGEISNFNFGDKSLELAPKATTKEPLLIKSYATSEIIKMSEYPSITKDSALQQNISFGFAIKYRLVEQNIDRTLYKENKYNLYDILSSM